MPYFVRNEISTKSAVPYSRALSRLLIALFSLVQGGKNEGPNPKSFSEVDREGARTRLARNLANGDPTHNFRRLYQSAWRLADLSGAVANGGDLAGAPIPDTLFGVFRM